MHTRHLTLICALAAGAAGCAAVTSRPATNGAVIGPGVVYGLPITRMDLVLLRATDGSYALVVEQPTLLATPNRRYALSPAYSPFGADSFTLEVNANGLLESVKADVDGQLDEAIANVAKSFGAAAFGFESAPDRSGEIERIPLVLADYVGENREDNLEDLNTRISDAYARDAKRRDAACKQASSGLPECLEAAAVTLRTRLVRLNVGPLEPKGVAVEGDKAAPAGAGHDGPDCSAGFCFRVNALWRIEANIEDVRGFSVDFLAPDASPTYVATAPRGPFTKWTTTATLKNGILTSMEHSYGAEGAAGALLPFTVVQNVVLGFSEAIGLVNKQRELLEAQAKLVAARRGGDAGGATPQPPPTTKNDAGSSVPPPGAPTPGVNQGGGGASGPLARFDLRLTDPPPPAPAAQDAGKGPETDPKAKTETSDDNRIPENPGD